MNHKSSLKMARRIFSWKDAQLAKQVGECVGLAVLRTWEQGNQNKIIMQEGYLQKLSSSLGPISSIQFPNFWPYLAFKNIYIISMKGKLLRRHRCTPLGLCVSAHRRAALQECDRGSYWPDTTPSTEHSHLTMRNESFYIWGNWGTKKLWPVQGHTDNDQWSRKHTLTPWPVFTATRLQMNGWNLIRMEFGTRYSSTHVESQLLKRLRLEDHKFKTNLGNTAKPYF